MLFWMVLYFSYVVRCFEGSLPKCVHSNQVLNVSAGELVEICLSEGSQDLKNILPWMCKIKSESLFQGVPLLRHTADHSKDTRHYITVVRDPLYRFHNQCRHNKATVLLLLSDLRISGLSSCERVKLWKKAFNFFPGNMVFVEDIQKLEQFITLLSMWPSGFTEVRGSAIIYFIGCGSIQDSVIKRLKSLEYQSNIDKVSNTFNFLIKSWFIADLRKGTRIRKRREHYSLAASSIFYISEKLERDSWLEGRVIIEGSGVNDQPFEEVSEEESTSAPVLPSKKYVKSTTAFIPKVTQSNTMPVVRKKLKNVTILIGSRFQYNISYDTYSDKEDGFSDKMTLKVYIRSPEMKTDFQVSSNNQNWIYYLPDQQAIVLRPRKTEKGVYTLVVCAYDSDKNRICDGSTITILKPESVTNIMTKKAATGVIWSYQLPEMWAQAVNSSEKDKLDVTVESSGPFEWIANVSTINLITEAYISREYQLKITAESMESGRKLVLLIIVNSFGHNAYTSATSVQIIITLRPKSPGNIAFSMINRMKDVLSSSIARYYHNRYCSSDDILIFKVNDGRNTLYSNDIDKSLTISFIYVPKISFVTLSENVNCSEVIISQILLSQIQEAFMNKENPWIIESIKLKSISGKCKQDLKRMKMYEERNNLPTITTILQRPEKSKEVSTWLNKTINITVRNGFIFKKIIIFSFQPQYSLIQKMELFDENNLVTDDSSWISLFPSEYALYGLPMSENVRSQPYHFKLDVILKSGATQLVSVIVVVEAYTPKFGHRFEMVIHISENDAMAHRSSFSIDQLLLSNTLSYRWLLVQTLGNYLQSGRCLSQCGMDIYTHGLYEPMTWIIRFSWSVFLNTADFAESSPISDSTCNFQELKSLLRSLFITDPSTDAMLSMFPSISNLTSRPNDRLLKAFISSHLGTPVTVSNHISSQCISDQNSPNSSDLQWSNITVFQGTIFAIQLTTSGSHTDEISYSKIYFENNLSTLAWIKLSSKDNILYGLPLHTDLGKTSTFSLRIKIEYLSGFEKNISIRITVLPNIHIEEKTHMILMEVELSGTYSLKGLDQRINAVRLLNQYIHPSCTLMDTKASEATFRFFDVLLDKLNVVMSCEKAEDVVLHNMKSLSAGGKNILILEWSQTSLEANKSYCNVGSIYNINLELFEKSSLDTINDELLRFFSNSKLGIIVKVQLCLYGACVKGDHRSKACINQNLRATPSISSSSSSTKTVLLVLFMVIVVVACVCLGIYFLKKGRNDGDHTQEPKSVEKSPLPNVSKNPKKLIMQEAIGYNLGNNSPTTPLLSPFFREDSKFDRHAETNFSNDDATGSYSFVASKTKSSDAELLPSQETGVPMHAIKQPTTSNVIRNPAMMMGSRLNPYRNIPPSIK